jgi:hypothetical protein
MCSHLTVILSFLLAIPSTYAAVNTTAPVAVYDAGCTNDCSDTDHNHWCGAYRGDSSGKPMRCMQYTRYGHSCYAECAKKSRGYYFCLTNPKKLTGRGSDHWWDYCSPEGFTINMEACTDTCGKHGEDYYWCHTSKTEPSKWDYCSPPGKVRRVEQTVNEVLCISECAKYGKSYYWCSRGISSCSSKNCPDRWDYCSPDEHHTRYNEECKSSCAKRGESYYWCDKKDGNGWDYCSPPVRLGVDVLEQKETDVTIYGVKCTKRCAKYGGYYWCSQLGGANSDWWDYCSPMANVTVYAEPCKDRCSTRGKSYYWCNTASSWGYCSPNYVPGKDREFTTPVYQRVLFWIFMVPVIIICLIGCCACCR